MRAVVCAESAQPYRAQASRADVALPDSAKSLK